jgi:hypothetical protein
MALCYKLQKAGEAGPWHQLRNTHESGLPNNDDFLYYPDAVPVWALLEESQSPSKPLVNFELTAFDWAVDKSTGVGMLPDERKKSADLHLLFCNWCLSGVRSPVFWDFGFLWAKPHDYFGRVAVYPPHLVHLVTSLIRIFFFWCL